MFVLEAFAEHLQVKGLPVYRQGLEEEAIRQATEAKRLGLKDHWVYEMLGL